MRLMCLIPGCIYALLASPVALAQQPGPGDPAPPPATDIEDDHAQPVPDPEPETVTFEQLQARLQRGGTQQRRTAAIELGLLGDPRAAPLLVSALRNDRAAAVRAAAAQALGTLRAPQGIGPLRRAASGDSDTSVQTAARTALTRMGQTVKPPTVHHNVRPRQGRLPWVDTSYKRTAAYRSGERLRISGILITAVGGGLGLLVGVLTTAAHAKCQDEYAQDFPDQYKVHCTTNRDAAIVGFSLAGASLGAGVPLWVVGASRMEAARRRQMKAAMVPQVRLALDRFTLRWQF